MTWDLTLLLVHILAAYGFALLFCTAPDRLQKGVLSIFMIASLVLITYYALAFARYAAPWELKALGYSIEHTAVLLYLVRILLIERLACKILSPRSRQSVPS